MAFRLDPPGWVSSAWSQEIETGGLGFGALRRESEVMEWLPAHEIVVGASEAPSRTVFVVHGIMGSGRNWRSFAGRLAAELPLWRIVLVDLRHHGDSRDAPGANRLSDCAADLDRLAGSIGRPEAIVGHSFGGKVALVYGRDHGKDLEQLAVLDCPVGCLDETSLSDTELGRVLAALETIPMPLARRSEASATLRTMGFEKALAGWMATNLRPDGKGGQVWSFDLGAIRELIDDYWRQDLHPYLENPPNRPRIHIVRAAKSDRWSEAELERLAHAAADGRILDHLLPDAGHWLHIDNPAGLLRIMRDILV